jgi:hypothetical protein
MYSAARAWRSAVSVLAADASVSWLLAAKVKGTRCCGCVSKRFDCMVGLLFWAFIPSRASGDAGDFASLFGRHAFGPRLPAAQAAKTPKGDGVRVFLGLLFDGLVFGFADGYIDDALGELVHIARTRGTPCFHIGNMAAMRRALKQTASRLVRQTESFPEFACIRYRPLLMI